MSGSVNMTDVVLKSIEENGATASLNRDLVVAHISPEMIDRETQMRKDLLPEIEAANKACNEGRITESQRDLIVNSAEESLARQTDFNKRLLAKRR